MPIPKILFRTVPAETSDLAEQWWARSVELTPGWEHITYRDPIDSAAFPRTARSWDACSHGAQMAGLVRLEALWNHGGVYIDSDVELWRDPSPLLQGHGFAGWEDGNTVPDAILGFQAGHPVLDLMIDEAIDRLADGPWESGPGVTTRNLPGRDDVLLLPPGSLYPYHWKRREKARFDPSTELGARFLGELRDESPWAFAVHHWRHSWR